MVLTEPVEKIIKEICLEISERYEMHFVEIGADSDHIHFLIQSVPMMSPSQLVQKVKSITGREVLRRMPELKKELWGSQLWTHGYFVNTVSRTGSENVILEYVKSQGYKEEYRCINKEQLKLFEF